MISIWLLLCLTIILCFYGYYWLYLRHARRLLVGLPTFPALPFLGHLHKLVGGGKVLFKVLHEISEGIEEDLRPFLIYMGPCPILITYNPDDVKIITNSLVDKPYYYKFARIWLGDGLVVAPVPIWQNSIKKLAGTFSTNIVEGYQGVFNAQAHKLVQRLIQKVGKEPFEISTEYLAYTTLEAICQTAFGVPQITESVIMEKYFEAFNRTLELFVQRGFNLLYHMEWIYKMTPSYREMQKCVAVIHDISDKVIIKRNILREEMKKNINVIEDNVNLEFKPVIDLLMDLKELDPLLTDHQIKSEVNTIMVGGQETIATTLFFALQMISRHSWIQKKVYDELNYIFKESLRPVSKEDLAKMVYCEAVLNETMRMYPPVPFVMRYADKELDLKSCRIPAGTSCGINVWGSGRSRKLWGSDALTFKPERWFEPEHSRIHASFLPFSYGRRACIGKKYAMALMKTTIAHCVRELEFIAEDKNLELKVDIVLKPISGHLMQVQLRK